MALDDSEIDEAVERYHREHDRYRKLVELVADMCREMVREDAIRATVQWRAKDAKRLRGKLRKKRSQFSSVDDVFSEVGDFAAVRVVTYVEADRQLVVDGLVKLFEGEAGGHVEPDLRNRDYPSFYRATHCDVWLPDALLRDRNANLAGLSCEVQVCSLFSHIWNELEHDLAYKPLSGEISSDEENALVHLGHLVRAGDGLVESLIGAGERRQKQSDDPFDDEFDFVVRMRSYFPESTKFAENSVQLFEEFADRDLTSPGRIAELLGSEMESVGRARLDDFAAYLEGSSETVPFTLDPKSSDVLLLAYLSQDGIPESVRERYPSGRGRGRPRRIRSVASRYLEFLDENDE